MVEEQIPIDVIIETYPLRPCNCVLGNVDGNKKS